MKLKSARSLVNIFCFILTLLAVCVYVTAWDTQDLDGSRAARDLADNDPLIRQRAAESLAHLALPSQKLLTDGYRLQEKNSKVRLALSWAVYRMGGDSALFDVVKDLDSDRQTQAVAYLLQLDSPEPLYRFVPGTKRKFQLGLLEVLARIGTAETLNVISPYLFSGYPDVVKAAQRAGSEILFRVANGPVETRSRPRRTETATADKENP